MSTEENVAQESTDTVAEELTVDQLRAELTKVRREAAAKRVDNNQLKETLAELQKYKDAEKSEFELLKERAEKAEAFVSTTKREKAAVAAAKAAGLDPELAEFLKGSNEEELMASAEALAARVAAKTPQTPDLFAGKRGEPVRAETSPSDAFRAIFL